MKTLLRFFICLSVLCGTASAQVISQRDCATGLQNALVQLRSLSGQVADYQSFQSGGESALSAIFAYTNQDPLLISQVITEIDATSEPEYLRRSLLELTGLWREPHALARTAYWAQAGTTGIRRAAIQGLGMSGLPDYYSVLRTALVSESDSANKAHAVYALAAIGNAREWKLWMDDLQRNQGGPPLGLTGPVLSSGQESDLEGLFETALGDTNYQVRMAAAHGIAARGYTGSIQALIGQIDKEVPGQTFKSPNTPGLWAENKFVKLKILEALQELGSNAAEAPLLARFDGEWDQDVVAGYLDTFGAIGSPACFPVLSATVQDTQEFWVMHAAVAAGKLHATSLLPVIQAREATVTDPYVQGRLWGAVHALQ